MNGLEYKNHLLLNLLLDSSKFFATTICDRSKLAKFAESGEIGKHLKMVEKVKTTKDKLSKEL